MDDGPRSLFSAVFLTEGCWWLVSWFERRFYYVVQAGLEPTILLQSLPLDYRHTPQVPLSYRIFILKYLNLTSKSNVQKQRVRFKENGQTLTTTFVYRGG